MSIETARECFLDMMERASITENADADITPEGRYIDRTTYTVTVTNRDLAILIEALGLDHRMTETTITCIQRHIKANSFEPAE
jgi:hypothetical protein